MLTTLLIGSLLIAATVAIHALGLASLARHLVASKMESFRLASLTWLLVRTAWILIFIHGIAISTWALAYWSLGCLPDMGSAFYFSGTTYTTIGYGDLVLPQPWRALGPLEGMTGILMCSLSGAFFFALVSRVLGANRNGQSGD